MGFLVLSLTMAFGTLFAVGCGESNPDAGDNQSHTHQYTTATVSPTCTALGYTTYTCDCGDTYKADYISAMGHDFTNYTSDNNATYEEDGTQSAYCNRDNCAERHTITTVGSKLTLDVFLELSVSGDYYIVTGLAKWVTVLQIPESYNQIPVKEIKANAFYMNANIKEVEIPDSITVIGEEAFGHCVSLEKVTIPNQIQKIDSWAFAGCAALESVSLPTGETEYGEGVFQGSGLKSIEIPASMKKIERNMFRYCPLESVTIQEGVERIDYGAFNYCYSLTSIEIPDSVTSIGSSAFYECSSLTSVTIGSGVTSIGSSAFSGCYSLTSISVSEGNANYASQDGILYNKAKTEFVYIPEAISGAVTIPDSITSIDSYAFYYCDSLTSIEIPDSVTSIGSSAFDYCDSLTSVTFEDAEGWYVTTTENATSGTDVTLTDTSTNATYLKSTYRYYYWYKKPAA